MLPIPIRLRAPLGFAALVALGLLATDPAGAAEKRVLTLAEAKAVAAGAVRAAVQAKAPGGAIAIVDDGGHVVYVERLDGTFAAAAPISIEKARSAAVFQRPTADFEDAIRNGRVSLVANAELLPLQGGVPIVVGGQVVGAIGVSGAASAQQDEELAKAGAASLGK
jgi:glc operon protein GlcG